MQLVIHWNAYDHIDDYKLMKFKEFLKENGAKLTNIPPCRIGSTIPKIDVDVDQEYTDFFWLKDFVNLDKFSKVYVEEDRFDDVPF